MSPFALHALRRLAGVCLVVSAAFMFWTFQPACAGPLPAADKLPADLALVPGDAVMLARMVLPKPLSTADDVARREASEAPSELLRGFASVAGIELGDLGSPAPIGVMTIIGMIPEPGNPPAPVLVLTASQDYDKRKLLDAMLPEAREQRHGERAWYTSAKKPDLAVAPIDGRVFVVGRLEGVRQLLGREEGLFTPEWLKVLRAASRPRYLTFAIQANSAMSDHLRKMLPPAWKAFDAALGFRTLMLTFETGPKSRAAIELAFADASTATEAAKAAGDLRQKAGQSLTPLATRLAGDPATRNLGKLLSTLCTAMKTAEIAHAESKVTVTATFAEDLEALLDAGSQELAVLLVRQGFGNVEPPLTAEGEKAVAKTLQAVTSGGLSDDTAAAIAKKLAEAKATEAAVYRLARLLRTTESPLDKIRICRVLKQIGADAAPAVSAVVALLKDQRGLVRRQAAKTLRGIGPNAEPSVSALAAALADAEAEVRVDVAVLLYQIGSDAAAALPALEKALGDANPDVRYFAAQTIRKIGTNAARAVPALAETLKRDADAYVRIAAAAALAAFPEHSGKAVESLTSFLSDEDVKIRRQAAAHLVEIGKSGKPATAALAKALKDSDALVRQHSVRALGAVAADGAVAVAALRPALADEDPQVRRRALEAMTRYPREARAAADEIIARLNDKDATVRREAVSAMEDVGAGKDNPIAEKFVLALRKLPRNVETELRRATAVALRRIAEDAGPEVRMVSVQALARLMEDPDPGVQLAATSYLHRLNPQAHSAVPQLTKLLSARSIEARRAGIEALSKMDRAAAPATAAMIRTLGDADSGVRAAAAAALGNLGKLARDAQPALRRAARDQNPLVRVRAAEALWHVDHQDAQGLFVLATELYCDDPMIQTECLESLRKIGKPARLAAPAVIAALRHTDVPARKAEIDLLGGLLGRSPTSVATEAAACLSVLLADAVNDETAQAAVSALAKLLRSQAVSDHRQAASALESIGAAAASVKSAVESALNDPDVRVRIYAAQAFFKIGGPAQRVLAVLDAEMKNRQIDRFDRWAAARALGEMGAAAETAVPTLVAALADPSHVVREAAANALFALGPTARRAADALHKALQDEKPEVRSAAAAALWRIDGRRDLALPLLLAGLKHEDYTVRYETAAHLEKLGRVAADAAPRLIQALDDPKWIVRVSAMDALAAMHARDALPKLRACLEDNDPSIGERAA